jgi:hypothetical protein
VATSLNQFSRAIGGALGVAILGAVLTAGLGYQLRAVAASGSGVLTAQQAEEFASNPNALIAPDQQSQISEVQLHALRTSMEKAIRPVFLVGAVMSLLAFFVSMLLPKHLRTGNEDIDGERMLMAEQTTINARNQPLTIKE